MPFAPLRRRIQAFSLIELLVVVAIVAMLAALSVSLLGSSSAARRLEVGGNLVVDLINQARLNSQTQKVMTAVVLVTNAPSVEWRNRLFGMFELLPGTSTWIPIGKWEMLPDGIVVDASDASNNSFLTQQPTLPAPFSNLSYGGIALSPGDLVCQVFTPVGNVLVQGVAAVAPVSPTLSLVPGIIQGRTTVKTMVNEYYNITINLYTGTPMVNRP